MAVDALEPYLKFIREGTRSAREVRDDLWEGRCRAVAVGRSGKLLSAEYSDGRRFDLIDDRFYTPEAYVALFLISYAMSLGRIPKAT